MNGLEQAESKFTESVARFVQATDGVTKDIYGLNVDYWRKAVEVWKVLTSLEYVR